MNITLKNIIKNVVSLKSTCIYEYNEHGDITKTIDCNYSEFNSGSSVMYYENNFYTNKTLKMVTRYYLGLNKEKHVMEVSEFLEYDNFGNWIEKVI